jgi:CubicO group peptidase (beta-lactamase class C family)
MSFLADTFIGRCLLWRTPTDRDHLRFPAEPAGAQGGAAPLPISARLRRAADLQLPAAGAWPGGSLDALLRTTGTTAFVLLHDGAIACEWFAPGSDGHTVRRTMSVTKSVASVLVGQAIGAGRIPDVDTRIGDVVDGIADPGVAALTLAQLLRMASGIGFRAGAVPWSDDARTYHGTALRDAARKVRLADPVDRFFHYNDWHLLLLALALERAGGASVAQLIARDLWQPLRAGEATVSLDRRGPDALGHLESGFNASAYGLARFGQLVLQDGAWEGRQLVQAAWLARLQDLSDAWRAPEHFAHYRGKAWERPLASGRIAYKDFWWHHLPRPGVHDVFAMGVLGAHVYVSPDTRCVVVRQSSRFPRGLWWAGLLRAVAEQAATDR